MVYPDSKCWGYSNTLNDPKAYTKQGMVPTAVMNMVNRVTSADPSKTNEDEELASMLSEAITAFFQ